MIVYMYIHARWSKNNITTDRMDVNPDNGGGSEDDMDVSGLYV